MPAAPSPAPPPLSPRPSRLRAALLGSLLLVAACAQREPAPQAPDPRPGAGAAGQQQQRPQSGELAGTRWQLAQILTADGALLLPHDPSLYSLAFLEEGRVALRVDCNQAGGPWSSEAPGQLSLGPLISTLAACPPGSLAGEMMPAIEAVEAYGFEAGNLRLGTAGQGASFLFTPAS